jgi:pimeloyl-ACP methyl ester carboxylesterase
MGYGVTLQKGRIFAGEMDYVYEPSSRREGKAGVVLLHGAHNPLGFLMAAAPAATGLAAILADAGFWCIGGQMADNSWGNDASLTRVQTAVALAEAATGVPGCYLLGGSMGGAVALRYMQAYPAKVKAFCGLEPVTDLVNFPTSAGLDASITAAWGVAAKGDIPARGLFSSTANKAIVANIPMLLMYASNDTVVTPASVTSFAASMNKATLLNVGALGHSDAANKSLPPGDLRNLFLYN